MRGRKRMYVSEVKYRRGEKVEQGTWRADDIPEARMASILRLRSTATLRMSVRRSFLARWKSFQACWQSTSKLARRLASL